MENNDDYIVEESSTTKNNIPPRKSKSGITFLVVVLVTIGLGVGSYTVYDRFINEPNTENDVGKDKGNSNQKSGNNSKLNEGTFRIVDGDNSLKEGIVRAKGYTTLKTIPGGYETEEYEYVYFKVLETNNIAFKKWVSEIDEMLIFAGNNGIGLGCIISQKLQYYNISDAHGTKVFSLSKIDTEKIMNSTKENPIVLEFEFFRSSEGSGALECFSNITSMRIP